MIEYRTIKELCSIVVDCPHSTPTWTTAGKIVVRNNNIKNGRIDFSSPSYTDDEHYRQRIKREIPQGGDIIITREAPMGEVGMIPDGITCCLGQRMVLLRANPEICDNYYLLYSLQSRYVQHQISWSEGTGTTVSNLRIPHLEQLKIPYLPLSKQKQVSSVLRCLEEKIEQNRVVNDNLQQQIRTLCNAWLNDYAPFGGVCPDDWELTYLASFAKFISGYSYKGNELQKSNIAMATIKNFDRKGGFKLDGYKEIVPSSKLKSEHHAELFDTLVAHTDLTQNAEVIGNAEPILSLSGYDDIIFSMDVVKVIPDTPAISKFLIAAMLQTRQFKDHCLGYVNGTTVLHLSKKALPEYLLLLPHDFTVLKPLDDAISSMYQQMALNIDESVRLATLRDNLLPKLMTGELDVSDIDL